MKSFRGVILAGALVVSLTVPVYADRSVKTELPQNSTDYYMTVDSGGVGVDIYQETSDKSEKLNNDTVEDGTVLHIEGETDKNGENWGYTEYNGTHGYVPLDELRPAKDEELTEDTGKNNAGGAVKATGTPPADNSEDSLQTDTRPVNGTTSKSFKEDSTWYKNPFLWIGMVTVLAVFGILGYHLKKR